jgi:hypothetical protein
LLHVVPGYAPLLVRLVQLLCLNNASWDCIADTLRQLPGPVLEFSQQASLPEELSEALDRWVCSSFIVSPTVCDCGVIPNYEELVFVVHAPRVYAIRTI